MGSPLISCVVPVYNGERYLAEAVESILAQTYRPLDVLVADDGSTDGTAEVAARYAPKVRFLTQATAGPAATRNLGLANARGDFVAFLDADDLWHAEKLERQMARFHERPDLDISVTHVKMFWDREVAEEAGAHEGGPRGGPVPGYATTTMLAPRAAFDEVGEFDTRLWFADATDWFLRAEERGLVIEPLPDVLVYHRMHAANLTRRRAAESREEFLRIVKASLDRRRSGSEAGEGSHAH